MGKAVTDSEKVKILRKALENLLTVCDNALDIEKEVGIEMPKAREALAATSEVMEERDFTSEEALAEARKRWGSKAWCSYYSERKLPFTVGNGKYVADEYNYQATSFRAAFAEADKKKEKP